jgi:hypothetical protein
MKYGRMPMPGAPLREFVRVRISHAKALWSRDVQSKDTTLQFREWLRLHVSGGTWIAPLWPDEVWPDGGWADWSRFLQILRIAYGFPRFARTKPEGAR